MKPTSLLHERCAAEFAAAMPSARIQACYSPAVFDEDRRRLEAYLREAVYDYADLSEAADADAISSAAIRCAGDAAAVSKILAMCAERRRRDVRCNDPAAADAAAVATKCQTAAEHLQWLASANMEATGADFPVYGAEGGHE